MARPAVDLIDRIPYTPVQAIVDPVLAQGLAQLPPRRAPRRSATGAIDAYVEHGARVTSPMSQTVLFRHGGAISRVPEDATAAGFRDAPYMWHPIAAWSDPGQTRQPGGGGHESSAAMAPFATGGVYLNFEQDEGAAHVRAGFSDEQYTRLVALKDKYDPDNHFRINQNIAPSGAAA